MPTGTNDIQRESLYQSSVFTDALKGVVSTLEKGGVPFRETSRYEPVRELSHGDLLRVTIHFGLID